MGYLITPAHQIWKKKSTDSSYVLRANNRTDGRMDERTDGRLHAMIRAV